MMAQDGVGSLPADTFDGHLGEIGLSEITGGLTLEPGKHLFGSLTTIEDLFKESELEGAFGDRRRAAESKAHPGGVQVGGLLGEITKEAFAGRGGEAVGYTDKVSLLAPGSSQQVLNVDSRAEEYRPPASGFRQPEEVRYPCHVDAFAQGGGNDCFHITQSSDCLNK
jgi:hypothetical protein